MELTESVFAEDAPEIIGRMHELCGRGVHDVHVDPGAGPIVEAIIALARKLKLEIVAEGVEHEAQRSFLVNSGCGALQRYLLGRPGPIADFERIYGSAGIGHA